MAEATPHSKNVVFGKMALLLFLLTLPLSVRKVLLVISPDESGLFNEYTDISLYLTDLALLLFCGIILLEHKNSILSISWWKRMFHVEHIDWSFILPLPFLCWAGLSILWSQSHLLAWYSFFKLLEGYLLYVSLILFIVPRGTLPMLGGKVTECSTWNISTSSNHEQKLFHVEQFSHLNQQLELSNIVPRGTIFFIWQWFKDKCSTWNIWELVFLAMVIGGTFQAFLGIGQFIRQSSLGLTFLQESQFVPFQAGIAKVILGGELFIRAYGLLPHPNVLAGFLGLTMLFTAAYPLVFRRKMFHVEHSCCYVIIVPRGTFGNLWNLIIKKCSTWNNLSNNYQDQKMFHVEQFGLAYRMVLFIQGLAFLLTFSKSAFLGLLVAVSYLIYKMFHVEQLYNSQKILKNVPRGTFFGFWNWICKKCSTWNNPISNGILHSKMFHVEQWRYVVAFLSLFLAIILFFGLINRQYFFMQSVQERFFIGQELLPIMSSHFFGGMGIGQSVLVMQDFFIEKLLSWQYQPIHSLYLLILAETGSIGFLFFLLFLLYLNLGKSSFKNVPRGTIANTKRWIIKNCSTWNNFWWKRTHQQELFHVGQLVDAGEMVQNVPRGTRQQKTLSLTISSGMVFMGVISLFDHYLWDIQQGQLLLWLLLGLFVASSKSIDK